MKNIHKIQCKHPPIAGHRTAGSVLTLTAIITLGLALGSAQAADSGARRHAQGGYDAADATYTVAGGDSLNAIAERFGMTVDAIKVDNTLQSDEIGVGETLVLAAAAADETSPTAGASTARCRPSSTRPGGRARSSWSTEHVLEDRSHWGLGPSVVLLHLEKGSPRVDGALVNNI